MAEVKWTARRVTDGVLVDVTGDTESTPQTAPTQNALEAGSAGTFIASATDPGAIGAGSVWKDTSLGISSSTIWRERNISNTGWDAFAGPRTVSTGASHSNAGPTAVASGSGNANARLVAEAVGDGNANASSAALADGDGEADASISANASLGSSDAYASVYAVALDGTADATTTAEIAVGGAGDATVEASATTLTGEASAGSYATRGAAVAGMRAVVDGTSARMGFFGATPVAKSAAITDATDAATTQARLNTLLAYLRSIGLIST